MIFKSAHPDIDSESKPPRYFENLLTPPVPTDLTVWEWLFESKTHSTILRQPASKLAGYTNAQTKERRNYADVKECATHISTALVKKYGMREGQTVLLFSQNTIWYPITMLAAIRAGGKVCGASPAYGPEEMSFALRVAQAKFLFTVPSSIEVATKAAKASGIPQSNIFLLEGEMPGYTTVQDLIKTGQSYGSNQSVPASIPSNSTNASICGFLCFTSGTSGLPKAVMLSHANLIAQALQLRQINPPNRGNVMAVLPMFHITGLVRFCITPISDNAEVVLLPSFSMKSMLETIVLYKIAEVKGVPPIMIRMVRDPLVDNYDLRHVERFASGSAPCSDEIIEQLARKFPGTGFLQGYGMTESTACISSHPPDKYDFKYAGTGGTLVANTVVKVMGEDGREIGVNESGEILAKGPQIAMGYLGNAEASREAFDEEGFLHTGDIGRIDEEGFVHILDRRKELIKVKGIGVAPAELEDLLLGHVDVEDCAVVGVQDDYAGERPKAFVVLKPGRPANEQMGQRLMAYVKEKKVRFKALCAVEFLDIIPKSGTGKILRRILRDREKTAERGLVVQEKRDQARL
jgi:4-coumarate--CoA ligase